MKHPLVSIAALLIFCVVPSAVLADQPPARIAEKMSIKLVRGVTNVATSVVELPKQTILTTRDMGGPGIIIGPLKGVGMTLYRSFIGVVETIFFMVPQPGYYDPTIDPAYVWEGWEDKRPNQPAASNTPDPGSEK